MDSMDSLERIADNPRVRIRKAGLNAEAKCILYWMRRSQRGRDNPALNVAIQAGNVLKKPVLVFFGLTPTPTMLISDITHSWRKGWTI